MTLKNSNVNSIYSGFFLGFFIQQNNFGLTLTQQDPDVILNKERFLSKTFSVLIRVRFQEDKGQVHTRLSSPIQIYMTVHIYTAHLQGNWRYQSKLN